MSDQISFFADQPVKRLTDCTQGRKANNSGQTAEDVIYCLFKERGYPVKRQVPIGANIYGHPTRVDLVIERLPGFEAGLIIERKWQAVAGSTDEKYVFLAQNIKQCYPHPTILLADGGGAKPGAIKWLKTQVDGHKLIGVFSLNELLNWIIDRGI